ncbi:hypothetical protein A3B02_01780 [Candidatus Roizmanbacteria bacterium RIFCSPLOWO2_01_FULL_42_14]|uniref:Diacylglycerol kinase n=3 Tax=Candidatus Roizmaniibacteriota TaxID=1752723 RepID=A0A1F7JX41_9BACT|nr:MAG: hypothetical protein A3D08_03770 [Candidatus Roizmanbacteria bacterium RIFCSPHIGHO2_02_FULL_43_11]OGK51532.1 MAG: hypothetical protein A3B02_01780 [Candidatus Roizmanbacteria bacterium RIFCSPLOWO2_01_FULL_42_14]OGK60181.1 MAG: hypothetical protein A3I56_04125 [Candidatus Roizmanbacteria bacterium RIFCSPLOWO2_02_FULL_43_10]
MRHLIHHHLRKHTISFKHAFDGIVWAWKSQPNYRVHTIIAISVVLAGLFFRIELIEWVMLTFVIAVGLVIETINTALEATADAITREWRAEIKIAKDASSAAMLTYAIGASIIAGMIFIPKIF